MSIAIIIVLVPIGLVLGAACMDQDGSAIDRVIAGILLLTVCSVLVWLGA